MNQYDKSTRVDLMERMLEDLTEEQRVEVFARFCTHCGAHDPRCTCSRDD